MSFHRVSSDNGMYDVQPTLEICLASQMSMHLVMIVFSVADNEENVVIFPNGNLVTDTVYYDSQKTHILILRITKKCGNGGVMQSSI